MNPIYNNRTYIIGCNTQFDKLFQDIAFYGDAVQETRELVNTRIIIERADQLTWGVEFPHATAVAELMKAIQDGDENMINDVYDSKHYTFLKDEIANVKLQFHQDCMATRRAVFSFPASHCFDSIQVLIRGGEVITTVNMRSCNAYKNLICDLYLAHRLTCKVLEDFNWKSKSIVANIGSLHIFKEDIKHVL